jgi:hypothetical protein
MGLAHGGSSMYLSNPTIELARGRAGAAAVAPSVPPSRFAVAREMLSTLETLTNAGRRHCMAKVVVFIEGQVALVAPQVGKCRRDAAMEFLEQLRRESSRPLPDVASFCTRADDLIGLLAPLAISSGR